MSHHFLFPAVGTFPLLPLPPLPLLFTVPPPRISVGSCETLYFSAVAAQSPAAAILCASSNPYPEGSLASSTMPSCVVQGCFSGGRRREEGVILHVFPKEREMVKRWLLETGQDFGDIDAFTDKIIEGKKYDTYRMCSKHFREYCYTPSDSFRKSLRKDAIPTVFDVPSTSETCILLPSGKRKRIDDDCDGSFTEYQFAHGEICPTCGHVYEEKPKMEEKGIVTEPMGRKLRSTQTDPRWGKRTISTETKFKKYHKKIQCRRLSEKKLKKLSLLSTSAKHHLIGTITESEDSLDSEMEKDSSSSSSGSPKHEFDSNFQLALTPNNVLEKMEVSHTDLLDLKLRAEALNSICSDPVKDRKFMVFESCLDELILSIPCRGEQGCDRPIVNIWKEVSGTSVTVHVSCGIHNYKLWDSQPQTGGIPAGNLLLSSAILFSGLTFVKVRHLFYILGLLCIDKATYGKHQVNHLFPAIGNQWNLEQTAIIDNLKKSPLCLSGDGQYDRPGHLTKHGIYTLLDVNSKKVVSFHIEQLSAGTSLLTLQTEACKQALRALLRKQLNIKIICTERKRGLRKMIKAHFPSIIHQYDIWQLSKLIGSKMVKVSRKKDCEELAKWVSAARDHLWWSAGTCNEERSLLTEKWDSILFHLINEHAWEGSESYSSCSHEPVITSAFGPKKWLEKGSTVHNEVKEVVLNRNLKKDLQHLSYFSYTREMEVFRSAVRKYRPKTAHLVTNGITARTQLAALYHNHNVHRVQEQVRMAAEEYSLGITRSKAQRYRLVKALSKPSNQDFLYPIMAEIIQMAPKNRDLKREPKKRIRY
ncbi:hypothetical protein GDO81_002715 [Engystomops pustulosus]|uniref:THAP-type domain-containing protein n=1 Tax=Engystomops pustulosus TaxID=76066 RepID=A0AAV6Z2H4_ENGPU|nr:hypothetical protein GDO81_025247 [Engystomops pustulosus]KAG8598728.1 hypothetical protein GDO81_002715 [Engystomops pustulosus]